jgi:predicted TPR repeat methyltransferase
MTGNAETFSKDYFDRFYESPTTRVHGPKEVARLVRGVTSLIDWFGGDLRSVLDIGAGAGLWRDWFRRYRPEVRYVSTDVSPYACEKYGHLPRDISQWRGRERFDLVVCQGVLPYLTHADAARALENIAAMARGFLYLEAITSEDLEEVCDTERTDVAVHRRSGHWYRQHLAKHFRFVGCGLYYANKGSLRFYELEAGARAREEQG